MNATTYTEKCGGPMSLDEVEFLRKMVVVIEGAMCRKWSLADILEILWHDINEISVTCQVLSQPISLSAALARGFLPKVNREIEQQASEMVIGDRYFGKPAPPIEPEDEDFLRDTIVFIKFAIDNGLTLAGVFDVLLQDINGIIASCRNEQHLSVSGARKLGFSPKVAYFAGYSPDQVGEPENL